MKTHKVLFLALIVSAILAVSVEAGDRRGNNSRSQAAASRGRSSGQSFSSGSSFRSGGRMIGPSQRFSSMGARSMPSSFRQRPTFNSGGNAPIVHRQFTPRTFTGGLAMILRVCRTTDRSEPIDSENCKARIASDLATRDRRQEPDNWQHQSRT